VTRLALVDVSDEDLAKRCRDGDEVAWDELLRRYGAYLHAVPRRAFGYSGEVLDEVFQDTCIRIYRGLHNFDGSGSLRSWLRAVVLSACREQARGTAVPPSPIEDLDSAVAPLVDEVELALDLRRAVDGLGSACRDTVRLYFFAQLTQQEVAARLGVPPGTIAARLSRCLRRLRSQMQEDPDPIPSRSLP